MAGLASQLEPGQGPQARLVGGWSWESGPQGERQIQQKWGGQALGEAGHGGFGYAGLGESRGHISGSGLAVGQPAGQGAVRTSVQRAVRAWP